jgi:DNA mismatch repair ATPase MutL
VQLNDTRAGIYLCSTIVARFKNLGLYIVHLCNSEQTILEVRKIPYWFKNKTNQTQCNQLLTYLSRQKNYIPFKNNLRELFQTRHVAVAKCTLSSCVILLDILFMPHCMDDFPAKHMKRKYTKSVNILECKSIYKNVKKTPFKLHELLSNYNRL